MNREEVVSKLEEKNLNFDDFLHFMSGKQMEINSNHDILFPKKNVYEFIEINNG